MAIPPHIREAAKQILAIDSAMVQADKLPEGFLRVDEQSLVAFAGFAHLLATWVQEQERQANA